MSPLSPPSPVERLFRPRSVTVIGEVAGESLAARVLAALRSGGFRGSVTVVSPAPEPGNGMAAFPDVASLPEAPDLALVDLRGEALAPGLAALAARGAGAAVLLGDASPSVAPLPVIGPRSSGVISPALGLNASLFPRLPAPGALALVCQDRGIAAAVLDHAAGEGIGLSHVVSLGACDGLGFTEVLDWLSRDGATRAVLLEVSRVKDRRGFLSAARAVARGRVVVALRTAPAPRPDPAADVSLPPGIVFAAALRRAGVVDVGGLEDLLDAATTLARPRRMRGDRVIVAAASPALGVLAASAARAAGATLAEPWQEASNALAPLLDGAAAANPLVLPPGAPTGRIGELLAHAARSGSADAAIAALAATGDGGAATSAIEALIAAQAAARGLPVIAAVPGGAEAAGLRSRLAAAGIAAFPSLEAAGRALRLLLHERRTRDAARELPPRTVIAVAPDRETVRRLLARAREAGRLTLTEDEAGAALNAYSIPTAPFRVASDPASAAEAARALGFPVVLKIRSPDLPHKTEVGGVVLDLETPDTVRAAAEAMAARVARLASGARQEGFLVQRQIARAGRQELFLRLGRDPLFGAAIGFGQGGTAAALAGDVAVELPPLNRALADALIARSRIAPLLAGFRDHPAVDLEALRETLVRLAQLAVDFPDVLAVDVNPLAASASGVMALDAWIRITPEPASGTHHLAIAPYPAELERQVTLRNGRAVTLRPIRPEDAEAHAAFFARLSPEDVRFRFFAPIRSLSPEQIARLTQIDYDREMAIIATTGAAGDEQAETLGVVRIIRSGEEGEFAIVVRSDVKGSGLGTELMQAGLAWARASGLRRVTGEVLAENGPMLAFVRRLGFTVTPSGHDPEVMVAVIDLGTEPERQGR